METVRKSNIELLRIILMIFVLLHHFLVWGAFPCMIDSSLPLSLEAIPAIYLNGFLFMAVNCFILISGYFGIKFDFRKNGDKLVVPTIIVLLSSLLSRSFEISVFLSTATLMAFLTPPCRKLLKTLMLSVDCWSGWV